jgi:hypothetical protein
MDIFSPTILDDALITGSNTANLLQVSSPSASSALFVSGSGNVGIGTATPSVRLHVSGTSTTNELVYLTGDASQGSAIRFNRGSSYSWRMGVTNASNFTIEDTSYSTARFQISHTSGLVGINTTSPNARLHISGANNEALLIVSSSTAPSALFVSGSGNVGIGTTTPTRVLYVSSSVWDNTTGGGVVIENSNTVGSGLTLKPSNSVVTNGSNGWAIYAGGPGAAISDGNLGFWAHGTNEARLVIQRAGNVGIGTTSPTSRLQVRGSGATSATTALRVENSAATARLTILDDGTSAFNTNHLYVSSSGNVGIGTTNPIIKLHISQSSGIFQRVDINDANADGVNATTQYYTNTGATADLFGATSFRLQGGTTDAFKQFQVYIANLTSPRFIINGSGNVGINTTSPNARLHISGANNEALLIASSSTAPSALFVSGSGFVGIGTTTPTSLLQVAGRITSTELYVTNNDAIYTTNGSVGIGTTTPSASLHVQGNLQISTGSLYTYGQNTDIDSGSIRTVMSVATGSYRAAFFDYVLTSGSNARAGTVFSVWQGTSVEYADTSTNDIGNTTGVNLLVSMSGANIGLFASSSNDNWSMKALARML